MMESNPLGDALSQERRESAAASPPNPGHKSLEGMHGSVEVPRPQTGFWRQWRAFVGPAILVSVGYMDPGNWGTDLAAGAQFKYGLLWVVALASLMAIFMQVISPRLGVVAGRDLAQCCRDWYRVGRAGPTGCSVKQPLAPVIWPRFSAAPWPSISCSTSPSCGR